MSAFTLDSLQPTSTDGLCHTAKHGGKNACLPDPDAVDGQHRPGHTRVEYVDDAIGTMVEDAERGGFFTNVVLTPLVTLAPGSNVRAAEALHDRAHHLCFVANSVNFPVRCEPRTQIAGE